MKSNLPVASMLPSVHTEWQALVLVRDKFMAFQMSGLNVKTDPGPGFSGSKDTPQNSIASTHSFLL